MKSKNIVTGTVIFSAITFIPPAVNLLFMPLYVKFLSIEEFGILSLLTSIATFFTVIGGFRVSVAITSYYFDYFQNSNDLKIFYGNLLRFALLSSALMFIAFAFPLYLVFEYLIKQPQIPFATYGLIVLGIGLINSVRSCYLVYQKNDRDIKKYSIHYLVNTILVSGLQILFITVFQWSVEGALWARLAAEAVGLLMVLWDEKNTLLVPWSKALIRKALLFSIPLIPAGIINWVYTFGDRFFIEEYLNLSQLGIYSFLITLTGLLNMLSDAILHGIQPYLFHFYTEGVQHNNAKISLLYKWYPALLILFASGIILLTCNLDLIISNEDYLVASKYVSIGIFVFLIEAHSKLFLNNLIYTKNARIISLISFVSVSLIVIFYCVFIPAFQIWGVILSGLLANLITLIITARISQRKLTLSLPAKNILFIPIALCLIFVVSEVLILLFSDYTRVVSITQFILISGLIIVYVKDDLKNIMNLYKKFIY